MGAYLSQPKIEKFSSDQVGNNVAYGASSMQGWRVTQEDAHNCCLSFDDNVSLFAVYDGHGGAEVAKYCAKNLPEYIKNTDAYKNGDIMQALIDGFLGFDATLAKPEVIEILKELAIKDEGGPIECSDDEDNVTSLCQEAQMPLDQVMKKYSEMAAAIKDGISEVFDSCSRQSSSYNKPGSSSSAGCSSLSASSSSAWNTNEADVSSSSQQCSTSSSSPIVKDASPSKSKTQISECSVSSESENALDSTTGNGDISHKQESKECENEVTGTVNKTEDMPDSSGDVKHCISASKKDSAEVEEDKVQEENGKSINVEVNTNTADSSKIVGDNVSSSSNSPIENGEMSKNEVVSGKRKTVYNYLGVSSQIAYDDDDDDDDEDDDDYECNEDDENDKTFHYKKPDSDEDDTEEVGDNSDSSESCFDYEVENEDDDNDYLNADYDEEEDDDDDDDEDVDVDDNCYDNYNNDPGEGSGCTAVVAVLKDNDLYVANAGDSRCVLCRDGVAVELSLDHKPEDNIEMERIVKAGGKVTAEGRVNGGLNLSRAIGDHSYKQNSTLPAQEQMISALPDVRHTTIDRTTDEFMILACDGIWNFMSSQDVVDFIKERLNKKYENLSKICEELFDFCLAPNTLGDGTGCDNMTAVIVTFKDFKSNDKVEVDVRNAVAKKRPAPLEDTEDTEDTTKSDITDEQKRQKMEETV